LFNNIAIRRKDGKLLPVSISYGPRSKWLEAQKQFEKTEEAFENVLPRMSYELVAMQYDTTRKLSNKNTVLRQPDSLSVPRQRTSMPVPYTLDYSLYLQTKNLNDGWQIMEQILPFFTPSYTVKVRHFPLDKDKNTPSPENAFEMPITLTAVTWTDDWIGDIGDRRTIEWQLEFSTKIWLHGPVSQSTVILDSRAIVSTPPAGNDLDSMNRTSDQQGTEVGYASIVDSDNAVPNFVIDSDSISPAINNLIDSEGNIVKIIRNIDEI